MALFKNIYHELQSRSKDTYPFADFDTVVTTLATQCFRIVELPKATDEEQTEEDVNKAKAEMQKQLRARLGGIAEEICFAAKVNNNRKINTASDYVVSRAVLLEIHLRFAFHVFNCEGLREDEAPEVRMSQTQALYLYIETVLKPFWASVDMTWHAWREQELWTSDNELLFTIYEPSLQALYTKFCAVCPNPEVPGTMTLAACQTLFSRETLPKIKITPQAVQKAYVFSKQTVIDETDARHLKAYAGLSFPEFCEMLGRVAWFIYAGTERESLSLHDKLLSVFNLTLRLVHGSVERHNRYEYIPSAEESTQEEEEEQAQQPDAE